MEKAKLSVMLDDDMYEELKKLKQEKFFDKSWAELLRYLIDTGIASIKKEKE